MHLSYPGTSETPIAPRDDLRVIAALALSGDPITGPGDLDGPPIA